MINSIIIMSIEAIIYFGLYMFSNIDGVLALKIMRIH